MTKTQQNRGLHYAMLYNHSDDTSIFDAYKSPSAAKYNAFDRIKRYQKGNSLPEAKILSHTCQMFTVGRIVELLESSTVIDGCVDAIFCIDTGYSQYLYTVLYSPLQDSIKAVWDVKLHCGDCDSFRTEH